MKKRTEKKQVVVIIPIYSVHPAIEERISIENTISKLSGLDIYFVANAKLNVNYYRKKYAGINIFKSKEWFIYGYNLMLLMKGIYRKFSGYKYMLIVQTDALLIKGRQELERICETGYDWYGAFFCPSPVVVRPWAQIGIGNRVFIKWNVRKYKEEGLLNGNGGLSLRNINKSLRLIKKFWLFTYNFEDVFFSYFGNKCDWFFIAPDSLSREFGLNNASIEFMYEKEERPFGIHKWKLNYPNLPNDFKELFFIPEVWSDWENTNKLVREKL